MEVLILFYLIQLLLILYFNESDKCIFNINDNCLETPIYFILFDLFLELFEVFEIDHHFLKVVFLTHFWKFDIHHLATDDEDTLLLLQILVVI